MTSARLKKLARITAAWLSVSAFIIPTAMAQDALKDRVIQLLEKLNAVDEAQATAAEASLVKLGAKVLSLLPEPSGKPEYKTRDGRLKKIRASLESGTKTNPEASKITIQGEAVRLSEALKALQQQSGNTVVDLREQNGQETGNPSLNLQLKDAPFFVALDEIAKKAGLALNFYTAENAIGYLNAATEMNPAMPQGDGGLSQPGGLFVKYQDAFRVALTRVATARNFNAAGQHTANLQMELAWEPRLRPIMLKLRSDKVKAIDDKGRELAAATTGESMELAIRPENPIVDLNLNLAAPPRDASKIAKLELTTDLTIPLAKRSLTIAKINNQGKENESGEASIRLMGFEAEPPVWKVTVELKLPGGDKGGEKLESYRQANLTPQVFLIKPDAARLPLNGGFSTTQGSTPNRVIYELLFVDIPGKPEDHGLLIEIPGELKTIPVKWTFQDIPLP